MCTYVRQINVSVYLMYAAASRAERMYVGAMCDCLHERTNSIDLLATGGDSTASGRATVQSVGGSTCPPACRCRIK